MSADVNKFLKIKVLKLEVFVWLTVNCNKRDSTATELCKNFKNTYLADHLQETASEAKGQFQLQ